VVEALRPIQERYTEWRREEGELLGVLAVGRERATSAAEASLRRVRQAMGFLATPQL